MSPPSGMTTSTSRSCGRSAMSVERVQLSYVSQQPCSRYSTGQRFDDDCVQPTGVRRRTFALRPSAAERTVRSSCRGATRCWATTGEDGFADGVGVAAAPPCPQAPTSPASSSAARTARAIPRGYAA